MDRTSSTAPDATSRPWELPIALDRAAAAPLRRQLAEQLRAAIRAGRLPAGSALPSTRDLAEQLGVSRGIVLDAYGQIAAEGDIELRTRARPVVRRVAGARAHPPAREPLPARYDLVAGAPDLSLFPRRDWLRAVRHALATVPDAGLDYDREPRGGVALRAALAAYLARVRGVASTPDQLLVTHGFKHGLDLVCRVLARRGARAVAVEDPSYDGTWDAIRGNGLTVVPVPVDGDGLLVDELARRAVDAVVVTPAHQFPSGVVLAPGRRRSLIDWAAATGGLILEDDYDAEYRYDRSPIETLQGVAPTHTVYLATASKTLAPALRLGWLAAPEGLAEELAQARRASGGGSRAIDEHAYAWLLGSGAIDRHLRRTRAVYAERREVLGAAVAERFAAAPRSAPRAGLHMVLPLGAGADDAAVVRRAAARNVRIRSLASYRLARAPSPPALVLGYGRLPVASIAPALDALAAAAGASGPVA
jgi:GntR family transcriptional regulator / MocR family aminotransferase